MSASSALLIVGLETWSRARTAGTLEAAATALAADDREALTVADGLSSSEQLLALTIDSPRTLDPALVREVRYLRRGPAGQHSEVVRRPPTADALDMLPHPEGGWFRETWRSSLRFIPPGYPGERAVATAIHFLLPPGEESMWHTVRSDELWFWHSGGPLDLLLGGAGDRPDPEVVETITVGPDVRNGHRPQALVPAGNWQAARPTGEEEVLVSCVVAPGFDFADFRALA